MGIRLGGRQKGTPNKVTKDVKDLARAIFDKDYWTARKKAVAAGTCPSQIEAKLLAYAYGEPKQEHHINTGITVNIGFIAGAEPPRTALIRATKVSDKRSAPEMLPEMIGPAHVPADSGEAG